MYYFVQLISSKNMYLTICHSINHQLQSWELRARMVAVAARYVTAEAAPRHSVEIPSLAASFIYLLILSQNVLVPQCPDFVPPEVYIPQTGVAVPAESFAALQSAAVVHVVYEAPRGVPAEATVPIKSITAFMY